MKNKPALLVIDFINDIVNLESKIANNAKYVADHRVIQHANQAIAIARELKIPIIFVKVGFEKGYPECPPNSPVFSAAKLHGVFQLGTWSTDYHPDLDFRTDDISITKNRVSVFYSTNLEVILHAQDIDTLILTGVSSAMAIDHTARDAHDRDYNVIVLADACGAPDQARQDAAMLLLQHIGQVIKVSELKGELA